MALESIFHGIEAFANILGLEDLTEGRYDNDANNNPIYVGYCIQPDGDPAAPIWFIQKVEYDGTAIVRKRLPIDGIKFGYVWNDRADYFP